MRNFCYIICSAVCAMLFVAVLFLGVQSVALNAEFYDREYRKLDRARAIGMDHSELMEVTDYLIDYLKGDKENLKIKTVVNGRERYAFDQREREHMLDVVKLYQDWVSYRNLALAAFAAVAALCFFLLRRDRLIFYARSYLIGASVVIGALLALGIWALIDFTSFWNAFHLLFFTNDLWQLDPATSLMINMFPEQFFYDMVLAILKFVALLGGIPYLGAAIYVLYRRYRRTSLLRIKEEK